MPFDSASLDYEPDHYRRTPEAARMAAETLDLVVRALESGEWRWVRGKLRNPNRTLPLSSAIGVLGSDAGLFVMPPYQAAVRYMAFVIVEWHSARVFADHIRLIDEYCAEEGRTSADIIGVLTDARSCAEDDALRGGFHH
jgi:hypothetical protein